MSKSCGAFENGLPPALAQTDLCLSLEIKDSLQVIHDIQKLSWNYQFTSVKNILLKTSVQCFQRRIPTWEIRTKKETAVSG